MTAWQAGVLGRPIGHSLSPVIHNAGYAAAGLGDWSYAAHDCGEAELAPFVAGLGSDWRGLSLTMPLKEIALEVADEVAPVAAAVGAANTLVHLPDGTWRYFNGICSRLSQGERDKTFTRYEAEVVIRVAAIKGAYKASLDIVDPQPPRRLRLVGEAAGKLGFGRGEARDRAAELIEAPAIEILDEAPEAKAAAPAAVPSTQEAHTSAELLEKITGTAVDSPLCFTCGTKMRPAGSCYVCEGCGSTSGCS